MIPTIGFTLRLITPLLLITSAFVRFAHAEPVAVDVECRWSHQAWEPCRFVANPLGSRWNLAFNAHRIQFEHDGTGSMRMRINERSSWNSVQASWSDEGALCWGEVCARGDLPMD